MKKVRFLAVITVMAIICSFVAACTPHAYSITVTGGTADKTTAAEGTTVTLTPDTAPAGSQFLNWKVNDETITGNTFEMPAKDTTAVAVFKKIDYTVTVTGGTADKTTAQLGDTVTLTVSTPAGNTFQHWTVNGAQITGNTFTMTAGNATAVAVFTKINYTVSVTGGTADKTTAQVGDTVTLTAGTAPSGQQFAHWTVNGTQITGNTFTMTAGNATAVAVFAKINYTVSVTGGTANKTTAQVGDTVTLTAGTAPSGQQFAHWTVNGTQITGNTFTMTAGNATVVAVFTKINYNVSVTGGTADKTTAQLGDTVTLTPGADPAGKAFKNWQLNGTNITGNSFVMTAANAVVTAVYVDLNQKIATPDNSANELIKEENPAAATSPICLDRAGGKTKTMFTDATDYALFYVYDSSTATQSLGSFKMIRDPANDNAMNSGVVTSMDGTKTVPINGGPKNYYIDTARWNDFFAILKYELGYKYSEGRAYYFAAKVVAKSETVNVDGFDITYSDSDMSAIGTVGIAKDKTKSSDDFTVTVTEGLIDGTLTTVSAGYGVTLTVSTAQKEGFIFTGWYLKDNQGVPTGELLSTELSFSYNITGNADLIATFVDEEAEKTPLATPDNTDSKLIYKEASGSIALDRATAGTMFTATTDYVIYYIYDAVDATEPVGSFKARTTFGADPASGTARVGWIESVDGVVSMNIIRGRFNDYYIDSSNVAMFYEVIRYVLSYDYSDGATYYFAAQAFAKADTINSDSLKSAIGTTGIVKDASKGTDTYTVTLLAGLIDGSLTTVEAGYGVILNLTAVMPVDKDLFLGWKVVTFGEDEEEIYGQVLSTNLTFNLTVTSSVTIRPVFVLESEVEATKLLAPDNSTNQMIKFSGALIEYDRQKDGEGNKKTAFVAGVAYIVAHIYASNESGAPEVGSFKITWDGTIATLSTMNGSSTFGLTGEPGNLYSHSGDAHNLIKSSIPGYSTTTAYYYAFQAIADNSGLYLNSDIGALGQGWTAI